MLVSKYKVKVEKLFKYIKKIVAFDLGAGIIALTELVIILPIIIAIMTHMLWLSLIGILPAVLLFRPAIKLSKDLWKS